ncbi:GNAT family N-acetyltransferase [Plantactinospora sp. GCM10030261]|uniref:GNAT family N-acetyltransferase n=1 Tax=Plantactinospora sp. GCM10030261 TaxID=3273420 RepID=UPI003618F83E
MLIRDERLDDHEAVRSLHRRAFGGAHGDVVAGLVDALRRDDPATSSASSTASSMASPVASFVAEEAGDVVGHVMFSRCLLDAPRRLVEVASLSPLAVDPRQQRRGVGSALIHHGLRDLDKRGVPLVFLEGDPRYYSRAGFRPAVEHGFRKPSLRIPDAAFQVVMLSGYEPWMAGTFVYSDTFWRLDCVGLRDEST